MADTSVVQDIKKKIEREKNLITGLMAMSKSTENPTVQAQADNQIRESRRNINYFEEKLHDLTKRLNETSLQSSGPAALGQAGNAAGRFTGNPGPFYPQDYGQPSWPNGPRPGQATEQRDNDYASSNNRFQGPSRPNVPSGPGATRATPRSNYSRLDLIKYDTAHLGPKIQYMLSQLEFKLSVEKQYKDGIEKIRGSYGSDGDRKIRKEAEARFVESCQKIELLKRSLKRYEDLHIMDVEADAPDDDSLNAPSMRKPLTGELYIQIHAVSDVTHYQTTSRFGSSKSPETFVTVKVEDDIKLRTRTTRIDRWPDESLPPIAIDQGNEVELTVFDKTSDVSMPIGLIWIRISDLVEEIRRKRIETELQASGWVAADRAMEESGNVRPDLQFNPPPGSGAGFPGPMSTSSAFGGAATGAMTAPREVVIDSWFALEPVGRIHMSLGFSKQTHERQKFENGLNRKGAIRQRKEEVHELYGHKFVEQQFYNIMRCALCGELLKYATGMQCADCKYMCHEKCYPLVVTKCISKSNAETDPDEAKLNHRIPHRFDAYKNIGANWCCHCGYMLPLGRKNCRRCKECKLTCHASCQHLVPDFCGMPMKDANNILFEIKNAQHRRETRTLRAPGKEPRPSKPTATVPQLPSDPSRPPAQSGRLSYGKDEDIKQHSQSPPQTTSTQRSSMGPTSAAASAFSTSSGNQPGARPSQDQRPANARHGSATAAAAAAAAGAMTQTSRPIPPRVDSSGYPTASVAQQQPVAHTPYNPNDYALFEQRQYPVPAPVQSPVQQSMRPPVASSQPMYTPDPMRQPIVQSPVQQTYAPQARPESVASPDARNRTSQPAAAKGPTRRIGLDHFNFLAVLGKGNFGKVMLAETKSTKKLYAIKVLKKEFIIENDEVESTRSERDVFIIANKARHPFLLSLHACFQTETRVYFVMEYISGGDLMLHIQRGQFGTKRAQFYAAEVCLALKYFHENGVVYRDLKLDNILLTMDGHIKIADYGLCKKDMFYGTTTRTFCGTPEFMAPEILLDKPYGRAVDWWAFGVLIYQMLLQQSPFRGEDEDEIYDAILTDEPLYPIHMPRDSVSILQKLLTREPELRLGSGPTDAQEIMSHAFFRNINWDDIANKRVPSPFMPQIKNATDTSNFDSEFTSVTPVLTPVQSVLTQAMQEEFRGFSYSADFE